MRLSALEILTAVTFCGLIAALVWLVYIVFRKDNYTREKFAFASLTAFSGMVTSVLAAMADKQTLLGEIVNFVRGVLGKAPQPEPARVADHVLMILVLLIVAHFILRLYDNWPGAISTRQYDQTRYHEAAPFLSESLHEAQRILKRAPAPKIVDRTQQGRFYSALEPPQFSLAWHIEVRDLICLRSPSYEIDRNDGWHDQARCWVGRNRKTGGIVAVKCTEQQPPLTELEEFIAYVNRIGQGDPQTATELILAVRMLKELKSLDIGSGVHIRVENAESLIHGLVDFSDYFAHITDRVERLPLADSNQTLSQVYVTPKCRHETGGEVEFESYVENWLVEPGQRQLALLGEYGQGKSTAAVMLAHHLIRSGNDASRIPVLIELRGKSPRNMTPEEIIAGWAFPYNINPRSVMKLLMAGRILLILEGFDEMALVGDSEARFSHFETLWKFCFPAAKILITGRPNFFLDDQEMRAALGISSATAAGPYCEALRLNPFTIEQIGSALRASPEQTRHEIVNLATKDEKFREIVSRGSLLYVVSQLWQREQLFKYAGRITSAFVMELFIKHSYRRQSQKTLDAPDFMLLTESERKYFTSGVAAFMGALDLPNQITRDQFERVIKTLYESIPNSASTAVEGLPRKPDRPLRERLRDVDEPAQEVANDVRSAGILVSDQSKPGALQFAHKSFMEYLIARAFGDYISKRDLEASGAIITVTGLKASHILSHRESTSFLAEILIGLLTSVEAQKTAVAGGGSSSLYKTIVVDPLGGGIVARLRGRLALLLLADRAHVWAIREKRTGISRILTLYMRLEMLPGMLFMALAYFVWFHDFIHHAHAPGISRGFWRSPGIIVIIAAILIPWQLLMIAGAGEANSAVRLWFRCCIVAGMKYDDIAVLTGRSKVAEISNLLLTPYRSRSYIGEPRSMQS